MSKTKYYFYYPDKRSENHYLNCKEELFEHKGYNLKCKSYLNKLKNLYGFNIKLRGKDLIFTEDMLENLITQMRGKRYKEIMLYRKERINFLKEINCYRGLRHSLHLPVRGQRTHTNSRTARKF